jgi:hypothetical protein
MTVGLLPSLFADPSSALDRVCQAGGLKLLMYRRQSSTNAGMMPKYCCLQTDPCLTVHRWKKEERGLLMPCNVRE